MIISLPGETASENYSTILCVARRVWVSNTKEKTMSIWKGLYIGAVALVIFSSGGCLVGGGSTTRREGNYASQATLNNIQPGKSNKAWVLATLGEPTSKTVIESGHELWKYSYKETKESGGFVFLLYACSDTKISDGTVFVEMQSGIVTKTWRG
jgi:outer membrane protein assembly factor BamE (lipoprotein component of BamABCDE complex)